MVTIGRFNIMTAVVSLSAFRAAPRVGHCWELISRISRVSRVSRISRIRRTKDRPAGGQGATTTMEVTVFSFAGTIASN